MKIALGQTIDSSMVRDSVHDEFYLPAEVTAFDTEEKTGHLKWLKHGFEPEYVFNKTGLKLAKKGGKEVFQDDYEVDPILQWSLTFVSQKTLRLQMHTSKTLEHRAPSLMLDGKPNTMDWGFKEDANGYRYKSDFAELYINTSNWELRIHNQQGKDILKTVGLQDNRAMHQKYTPFSFIKNPKTHKKTFAFSTGLSHNERLYGCGESFTSLNKRGQKINLHATDVQSALTQDMYKPIPFFMSDKGYGIFVHSSALMTFDFGFTHNATSTLYIDDALLDIFIFIGNPKDILDEYTMLTGKSVMPPIWSFGLWMSRLSYQSQEEVENIADKLRSHKIPSDVIHIDAGWFENCFHCDYTFGKLFSKPQTMISKLKELGFKTSLWQMTYYHRNNPVYREIVEQNLYIKESNELRDDVILDFSNPEAIKWFGHKINTLLELGVAAIKADFGESAPISGRYHSNQSGIYEHNLYALRYTSILYNILKNHHTDTLIWARSAWAGCQRFPVHWSGDPEVSNEAMASTLRAGLSLGLSGFTFWSHDIGGFSAKPNSDLFLRWSFMGVFSSHTRVHGLPPREPWLFGDEFVNGFRQLIEIKYRLLPYIISQSNTCVQRGHPLLRPLFFDFGNDLNTWPIEDQYMFGEHMLIAPFFENNSRGRLLYLPKGDWFDYFTNAHYKGNQWVQIESQYFGIALVKSGSCIPHIKLNQSTVDMDWSQITLKIYSHQETNIKLQVYSPLTQEMYPLKLSRFNKNQWELDRIKSPIHFKIQSII